MDKVDLEPAGRALLAVVDRIDDADLGRETPCPGVSLGQLLQHVVGLTEAFRAAADKELGPLTDTAPDPTESPTVQDGWREALHLHVPRLVRSWRRDEAWQGMTRAGDVDLPGDVAGRVALDEIVVHGWDVARASGQDYEVDDATARACLEFAQGYDESGTPGLFGPAVPIGPDSPVLDRLLARTGRDPRWTRG